MIKSARADAEDELISGYSIDKTEQNGICSQQRGKNYFFAAVISGLTSTVEYSL